MTFLNALFLTGVCLWLVYLWRHFNEFEHLALNKLNSYELDKKRFFSDAKFAELSNRFTEIENMPEGYAKMIAKDLWFRELDKLMKPDTKNHPGPSSNIIPFHQQRH